MLSNYVVALLTLTVAAKLFLKQKVGKL
jgi:hypothetical protein